MKKDWQEAVRFQLRHPGSLFLKMVVFLAAVLTIGALFWIIIDILIKGMKEGK